MPDKVTELVEATKKTRYVPPVPGRTVSLSGPGPVTDTAPVMSGSARVRLMMQTPAVQNGSEVGMLNWMTSVPPALRFDVSIAARKVHFPVPSSQMARGSKFPPSPVLSTV
jgi:hypothetical protein